MKAVSFILAINILMISIGFSIPIHSCTSPLMEKGILSESHHAISDEKKCCGSKSHCSSEENDGGCCDDNDQYFQQDFMATQQVNENTFSPLNWKTLYISLSHSPSTSPTAIGLLLSQCEFGTYYGSPASFLQVFRI